MVLVMGPATGHLFLHVRGQALFEQLHRLSWLPTVGTHHVSSLLHTLVARTSVCRVSFCSMGSELSQSVNRCPR